MIDHIYVPVLDVARSRGFYRPLLHILGMEESLTMGESVGFGVGHQGALWLYPSAGRIEYVDDACGLDPESRDPLPHLHVAFQATMRSQVHDFYDVAKQLDAGVVYPPRLFPSYHPDYFATFIRDPDGHNVEAVCHTRE